MAAAAAGTAFSSSVIDIRCSSSAGVSDFKFSSTTTRQLSPFKSSSLRLAFSQPGSSHFIRKNIFCASVDGVDSLDVSYLDADNIPTPIVLIDQDSDPAATIVQVSFGDRLGALIDTMKALKDLGLDVAKGTVTTKGSVTETKFFITRLATGRKVEDPDLLERIRLTIINNLLKYHPESSSRLAMGEAFGIQAPVKQLDSNIATHIHVKDDGPKRSLLCIETEDRPGLLLEVIKIMADVNITVESAEIDTEGLVAKDKFHVSYRGAALNNSLSQELGTNWMIDTGFESHGLYRLSSLHTFAAHVCDFRVRDAHCRLGHPYAPVLRQLRLELSSFSDFHCESCQSGKRYPMFLSSERVW